VTGFVTFDPGTPLTDADANAVDQLTTVGARSVATRNMVSGVITA
jgi:hypothetical protein